MVNAARAACCAHSGSGSVSGRIRTDCALWALSAAVQLLHEIGVKPAEVEATYCLHTNKYGARWGAGWSAAAALAVRSRRRAAVVHRWMSVARGQPGQAGQISA